MTTNTNTAVVLIDPYNDFLHPDGKLYGLIKESLETTDSVTHMKEAVTAAREKHIPIFYGLHQQYKEGHYDGWEHLAASHVRIKRNKVFAEGTWGAEIYEGLEPDLKNGDVTASKHWNSRPVSRLSPRPICY